MACEMLCFTVETAVVGREGRICETAVAGYVRAVLAPRSFGNALCRAVESSAGNTIGDSGIASADC